MNRCALIEALALAVLLSAPVGAQGTPPAGGTSPQTGGRGRGGGRDPARLGGPPLTPRRPPALHQHAARRSPAHPRRRLRSAPANRQHLRGPKQGCDGFSDRDLQERHRRSGDPGLCILAPEKRGLKGHAAMVWVHGYVHGRFEERHLPFVKEAVARGYVIVTPQYRGSTGYTNEFEDMIDYGGKEIDDAESAYTFIKLTAIRRSGASWHHGMEPWRVHHLAHPFPRQPAVQGGRRQRAGDESRSSGLAPTDRTTPSRSRRTPTSGECHPTGHAAQRTIRLASLNTSRGHRFFMPRT